MSQETKPGFSTTPLHEAADAGDLPLCRKLVDDGADIDVIDEYGWSPLIRAVQRDHVEVARYLLTQGAPMSYTYQREETPDARKDKNDEMLAIDERLGLRESMREHFKDLPPHLVEEMTGEKARREMRESMVDLHFAPSGEHAIEHARSLPMLELLVVGFGADLNHVAPDGYWPLSSFAESGDLPAVRWLLDHGADPNNTSTGETAIFKALHNDNLEMIQLLIERGAKVNIQDVDGWTPLFACQSVECAKLLLGKGADPTITDQCDFPCWHWTKDPATRDFLKASAEERGMRK